MNVGDLSGMHQTTVSKVIAKVSGAIASLYPQFIYFPRSEDEILFVQSNFYQLSRFPRCVGALDCTHIKIKSPGGPRAEIYRNRKGYFSYNVQGICTADLFFTNVVARWSGGRHDTTIFNNSSIKHEFDAGRRPNQILLADGAYACNDYTMTPVTRPLVQAELVYNQAQRNTRNTIERCFGLWKRRFPVLCATMDPSLDVVEDVIIATAVLHNIARKNSDALPSLTPEQLQNYMDSVQEFPNIEGPHRNNAVRNNIIFNYFANNQ